MPKQAAHRVVCIVCDASDMLVGVGRRFEGLQLCCMPAAWHGTMRDAMLAKTPGRSLGGHMLHDLVASDPKAVSLDKLPACCTPGAHGERVLHMVSASCSITDAQNSAGSSWWNDAGPVNEGMHA
jgi:hypothetical protein